MKCKTQDPSLQLSLCAALGDTSSTAQESLSQGKLRLPGEGRTLCSALDLKRRICIIKEEQEIKVNSRAKYRCRVGAPPGRQRQEHAALQCCSRRVLCCRSFSSSLPFHHQRKAPELCHINPHNPPADPVGAAAEKHPRHC